MTIETPLWMQGAAGVPSYPARLDRMLFAQLWDEGVMDLSAFKVTQRAAGANFTVDVSIGEAVVQGDDQVNQGNYIARATAPESGAITAAPGANSRIDIVCLRMNDPNAGGPAGYTGTIVVTAGAVSATPVAPITPASSLLLATVGPISVGTGSITNAIIADVRTLAGRRCTPGTIEMYAGAVAPSGWLLPAGQAVSRATYARLFAHLGTTYGVGDGATTFNLPDLRGRVPVGVDNMGGTDAGRLAVANTLGGTGGAETVALTTAELAIHSHGHNHFGATGGSSQRVLNIDGSGTFAGIYYASGGNTLDMGASNAHNHTISVDSTPAGSGTAHNNMPPYQLVNYIIRT